jgi:flavin reductase (DIM6/NTAB) family NADH-FMN oxidoreductase RutF
MALDSRAFRDALGHFATGVAVVSVTNSEGGAMGLTINSFASVSLEPPLVLWSLDRGSDRFQALMKVDQFGINILGQEHKDLSHRLSRKGQSGLAPEELVSGPNGVTLVRSAIASFECDVFQRVDAGDHVIFIGRVLGCAQAAHEEPLVYFRGAYRSLAAKT